MTRHVYPIELILTGCSLLLGASKGRNYEFESHYAYDARRLCILYCLQKIEDGIWIPLSREYKPLGLNTRRDWVDYKSYPFLFIKEDEFDIEYLRKNGFDQGCAIFAFNDGCSPFSDTSKRNKYIKLIDNTFLKKEVE